MDLGAERLNKLNLEFGLMTPEKILEKSLDIFEDKISYVCSFGTESAILLHIISQIDKSFPIILLNTHFLFDQTLLYKKQLISLLGLNNCKEIFPKKSDLEKFDIDNSLWRTNVEKCCEIRKVIPLNSELKNYDAWVSGRKNYHQGERKNLKPFEVNNKKIVVNPLINFNIIDINEYFSKYNLPRHPLFDDGYLSIGCTNCTQRSSKINDPRSGRWANTMKTECGIHYKSK